MPQRKCIQPGTKVGLKLTVAERKLILDDLLCLDASYAQALRDTPAGQPVQFTLDEWEDFGGYIAAEANHAEDKKLEKKLDAIFGTIQKLLDNHLFPNTTRRIMSSSSYRAKAASDSRPKDER